MLTHRLQTLFRAWMDRTASTAEQDDLLRELDALPDEDLETLLQDAYARFEPRQSPFSADQSEALLATIRETIRLQEVQLQKEQPEPIRLRRPWWRHYGAAAAVLLFLVLGITLYRTYIHRPAQPTIAKETRTDIAPGGNKAILTLAGGQQIILDSAGNGLIAQQGGASVNKASNGRLVYHLTDSSSRFILRSGTETMNAQINTLATPRGGQYQLTLSDGTKVWLNASSSITYPTAFSGQNREVSVTGEAYFEVAPDKTRPFHVKVNDQDIRVLGTHFNVNAYPDEAATATTLLEGSVQVTRTGQTVTLRPGQQALAQPTLHVKEGVDLDQVVAWKNGLFNFNNADLAAVLRQLGRWYDVDTRYEGSVPLKQFAGELPRDLQLSQVLTILGRVGVKFRIEGKTIVVMP